VPIRISTAVVTNASCSERRSDRRAQEFHKTLRTSIAARPFEQDGLLVQGGVGGSRNGHCASSGWQARIVGLRACDQTERRVPGCDELQRLRDILSEYGALRR
jgi:hypothetical protein